MNVGHSVVMRKIKVKNREYSTRQLDYFNQNRGMQVLKFRDFSAIYLYSISFLFNRILSAIEYELGLEVF